MADAASVGVPGLRSGISAALYERALLLRVRQPGLDVPKSDGVCPDTKRGPPLLGDGLGQAGDSRLGHGVVGLASVAVDARGGADVDDAAVLAIFDAEIGGGGAHEAEGRG
ncbi:transcription factor tfiiic complex subunit [Colletotrichum tofieldiae]|nr:transcription factor tfiiic complex subunit [Colletotrichum tofieldiae]